MGVWTLNATSILPAIDSCSNIQSNLVSSVQSSNPWISSLYLSPYYSSHVCITQILHVTLSNEWLIVKKKKTAKGNWQGGKIIFDHTNEIESLCRQYFDIYHKYIKDQRHPVLSLISPSNLTLFTSTATYHHLLANRCQRWEIKVASSVPAPHFSTTTLLWLHLCRSTVFYPCGKHVQRVKLNGQLVLF